MSCWRGIMQMPVLILILRIKYLNLSLMFYSILALNQIIMIRALK